jgi:hypothetical protein
VIAEVARPGGAPVKRAVDRPLDSAAVVVVVVVVAAAA